MAERQRSYVLPIVAGVLAFTVVYFGIFYAFGADRFSWYWWPFYPIGAIVVTFLVLAWHARRTGATEERSA